MKIWNATIHTMTDAGILENGYVCIENGKITAVESGKPAELSPEDIDAGGSVLLPGFIDAALSKTALLSRGTTATKPPILLPRICVSLTA